MVFLFVTSLAKEVMVMLSVLLAGLSVCLSVSKITQKSYEQIVVKFYDWVCGWND